MIEPGWEHKTILICWATVKLRESMPIPSKEQLTVMREESKTSGKEIFKKKLTPVVIPPIVFCRTG